MEVIGELSVSMPKMTVMDVRKVAVDIFNGLRP